MEKQMPNYNTNQELISIVMPVYKTLPFLPRAIESVQNQTYPHWELIIVDDGSPDESGSLCEAYAGKDGRIRVIHQENGGLSSARNRGIQEAEGEWLAFLDSDDAYAPSYLEDLYACVKDNNTEAAVCGWLYEYESGEPSRTCLPEQGIFSSRELLAGLSLPGGVLFVTAWNRLSRKSLWDKLFFPPGKLHEDEFTAHEIIDRAGRISALPKALYYYRQRSGSITNVFRDPRHWDGAEALLQRYDYLNRQGFPELLPSVFKGFMSHFITCLRDQDLSSPAVKERINEICRQAQSLWQREGKAASLSERLAFKQPSLWKALYNLKQKLKRG